jgi:hypothetical protein
MKKNRNPSTDELKLCNLFKKKGYTAARPLVVEPEYLCAHCARVARAKDNLCEPRKM